MNVYYKVVFYSLFIITGLLATSCQDEILPQEDISYQYRYYPLDSTRNNSYVESRIFIDSEMKRYDTICMIYNDFFYDCFDSSNSIKKYEFLEKTSTCNTDGVYSFYTYWEALDNNKIIKSKNNILYLKLNYPFDTTMSWNHNLYNTLMKKFIPLNTLICLILLMV
ncbi:MAG: hypothetical protein IPO21_20650 [Bacteroidales bacterium]|nr:hypothetical protein [Bacteroidales bacterium]